MSFPSKNKKVHSGDFVGTRFASWTASDTVSISVGFKVIGLSVNADGNIAIVGESIDGTVEDAVVTVAVKAGIIYPISPKRINSTNTTATGIVLYG